MTKRIPRPASTYRFARKARGEVTCPVTRQASHGLLFENSRFARPFIAGKVHKAVVQPVKIAKPTSEVVAKVVEDMRRF